MLLSEPTLVLNKSWRVISVTTVRKALALLYEGAARAVSPETYEVYDFYAWIQQKPVNGQPCIRTMRFRILVPEVIQLTRYDGFPPKGVNFSRKNVYKRDSYICQYCGARPGIRELTVDHIIPRCRGGRSDWINCVSACAKCNKKKGSRTLEEAQMKLIRKPFRPEGNHALFFALPGIKKSWEAFLASEMSKLESCGFKIAK
jgi:5-methylcytosine-specific restriction endonuclease McrA